MDSDNDAVRPGGCFSVALASTRVSMPASEALSKNLRSGSKTSSLTRWWNSNSVQGDADDQKLSEEEFAFSDQLLGIISDELLGLDIKPDDASSKTAKKPVVTNDKPTHERKLSWPFAGNRKVVPQSNAHSGGGVPSDEGSVSPLASSAPNSTLITPDASYHSNYSHSTTDSSSFALSEAGHVHFHATTSAEDHIDLSTSAGKSPQGYRRLWQSIASVRKGDKVAPTELNTQPQEYTVDSLVRGIMSLKASQPILEAPRLSSGLRTLDSRAVAALLKELSKAGQQARATELFDYLRSLPEDDPLSPLADLYTYTTVISQCGGHQHLRRALELVAEMRGKGIQCNVHTYSALMSVCVKCK
jgi:pentatricopeptide repeat protein